MRTVGVVTVGRSDYGIYIPVLRAIEADPRLELRLLVSGAHLSHECGFTVDTIRRDGFPVADCVEMLLPSDAPVDIARSMGRGVAAFAESYARSRPDILLALGDRFEMHAAVLAALPFKIPVAHIHGGELTFGAIDDALRHSITKLSHLHFAATEEYAGRIVQLGEEPWRVTLSGAPGLDHLSSIAFLDREELERRFSLSLPAPPLLVTFHPVTLEFEDTGRHISELLAALDSLRVPMVFTMPNADTGGRVALRHIREFVDKHPHAFFVDNLGTQAYFSLMKIAAAMVGNSSSGIIEAASFQLPVVNIGSRQAGRVRARNVIDVDASRAAIEPALAAALGRPFRDSLAGLRNPYGRGGASAIIAARIAETPLDQRLIVKRFYDAPPGRRP